MKPLPKIINGKILCNGDCPHIPAFSNICQITKESVAPWSGSDPCWPAIWNALATPSPIDTTDTERLDALEQHLKDESIWQDTVLSYDHEDGIWLARGERGTLRGLIPLEAGRINEAHKTLRAAIDAAFELKIED